MSGVCRLIWCALIGLFRSRSALRAEILVLRHQLNVGYSERLIGSIRRDCLDHVVVFGEQPVRHAAVSIVSTPPPHE
jgi:hypothetical protein